MLGEGEAQPDAARQLRAVVARAQEPDRRHRDILRHHADRAERMALRKPARLPAQELLEPLQEIVVRAHLLASAQCQRGPRVGTGRTADAEIDAARIEPFEHLEPLRHHQGRMVRQHHPARADADPRASRQQSRRS